MAAGAAEQPSLRQGADGGQAREFTVGRGPDALPTIGRSEVPRSAETERLVEALLAEGANSVGLTHGPAEEGSLCGLLRGFLAGVDPSQHPDPVLGQPVLDRTRDEQAHVAGVGRIGESRVEPVSPS